MLIIREGGGIVNSLINKLPIELHLPGYNFCGPGTHLKTRLQRGDRGVNPLDEACREHDIAYSQQKDLSERHKADTLLANKAWERVRSSEASTGEKTAAWLVTNIMKAKRKFGMGAKKTTPLTDAIKKAKCALKKRKVLNGIQSASKIALKAAKLNLKRKGSRMLTQKRIIPLPKTGGILPLIPIFAGLSALGSLAGGAAGIANTVVQAQRAKKRLIESERHNKTMEAIALGKSGKGLYLKPYKSGLGLYINHIPSKNLN